ncbi:MAG: exodeoxyribonuclease VII large subunit [Candidatus Rokubacteria bacterium]|nr:exodeoxyribonuclease VII large subunit [Candidatus Rokubacteria bacterium]
MSQRRVLTVSELSQQLREALEQRFPAVWVEGEISNFKVYGSGHAYFTLKDAQAQVRAVLFRNRTRRIRFEPRDGQHVLAFGAIEVYAQRGEYQLVVELLEPRGLGALQLAYEQLKSRLAAEGLFDQGRKRPLPRFPRTIGIVTSPSGAAIRDMLRVIGRRFGELHIVIAPARVQGEGAAEEIARGIADLNRLPGVDVIIVGRGGGSLEDLWAFNEEVVARAIVASKAPIISAVGHEVDVTISDFVADLRAPTPSAAAELVVREKQALVETVHDLTARLERAMRRRLDRERQHLGQLASRRVLTDPARPLRDWQRRLDDATARLGRAIHARLRDAGHRSTAAAVGLRRGGLLTRLAGQRRQLDELDRRLRAGVRARLERDRHRLRALAGRLDSLSPLAVLARGYSLARLENGDIVRDARQAPPGSRVDVLLSEGRLACRVESATEHDVRPHVEDVA